MSDGPKEATTKNLIDQWLRSRYGLQAAGLDILASRIVKDLVQQERDSVPEGGYWNFIGKAFHKWFKTTGIPKKDIKKHSSYGFHWWLRKHYWIIAIRKPRKIKSLHSD